MIKIINEKMMRHLDFNQKREMEGFDKYNERLDWVDEYRRKIIANHLR